MISEKEKTMAKKAGKFASVYRKTSTEFKNKGSTFDQQNHQRGWAQKEIDHIVGNPPAADQRVSDGGEKAKVEKKPKVTG